VPPRLVGWLVAGVVAVLTLVTGQGLVVLAVAVAVWMVVVTFLVIRAARSKSLSNRTLSNPGYPGSATATPAPAPISGYRNEPANRLAMASLVTSLSGLLLCGLPALAGAIMGHVVRGQIRQRSAVHRRSMDLPTGSTPEQRASLEQTLLPLSQKGNGLALAGIIIGWIVFVLWLVFWVPFAWGFFEAATAPTPR
jgi:hypothetical protein